MSHFTTYFSLLRLHVVRVYLCELHRMPHNYTQADISTSIDSITHLNMHVFILALQVRQESDMAMRVASAHDPYFSFQKMLHTYACMHLCIHIYVHKYAHVYTVLMDINMFLYTHAYTLCICTHIQTQIRRVNESTVIFSHSDT